MRFLVVQFPGIRCWSALDTWTVLEFGQNGHRTPWNKDMEAIWEVRLMERAVAPPFWGGYRSSKKSSGFEGWLWDLCVLPDLPQIPPGPSPNKYLTWGGICWACCVTMERWLWSQLCGRGRPPVTEVITEVLWPQLEVTSRFWCGLTGFCRVSTCNVLTVPSLSSALSSSSGFSADYKITALDIDTMKTAIKGPFWCNCETSPVGEGIKWCAIQSDTDH